MVKILSQEEIDALLKPHKRIGPKAQAAAEIRGTSLSIEEIIQLKAGDVIPLAKRFDAERFQKVGHAFDENMDTGNLHLLLDIQLPVVVRLGQTELPMGELLKLTPGSILELNRSADAPIELLVNGKRIALGEVVVVEGDVAFRITEIDRRASGIRGLP